MPASVSTSVTMVQRVVISYVPPRNTRASGTANRVVRMSVICIVSPPSSPLLHAPLAQQTAIADHVKHLQEQTHGGRKVDEIQTGGPSELVPGKGAGANDLAHPLEDVGTRNRPGHLLHGFRQ